MKLKTLSRLGCNKARFQIGPFILQYFWKYQCNLLPNQPLLANSLFSANILLLISIKSIYHYNTDI